LTGFLVVTHTLVVGLLRRLFSGHFKKRKLLGGGYVGNRAFCDCPHIHGILAAEAVGNTFFVLSTAEGGKNTGFEYL